MKTLINLCIAVLIMLGGPLVSAQHYNQQENFLKANSVWAFGAYAGLNFNIPGPATLTTPNMVYEGSASVADMSGQFLFQLGSLVIFRGNGQIMPNGFGLYPSNLTSNSAQGALILPVIDTPWKYYVFTNMDNVNYNNGAPPPFLGYSVVDMTLDTNRGDVEPGRKNIPLEITHPLTEGMIAIPGDNCDIWLLTHTNFYPNNPTPDAQTFFKAWHITSDGIDPNPVISPYNGERVPAPNAQAFGVGCMAVSPDRRRIALASGSGANSGILLCRFDPATGIVSDGIRITALSAYGVCFSPDNNKLYATSTANNRLTQYRIAVHDSATIAASAYTVAQGTRYMGLKLYRDTIYVATGLEQINTNQLSYPYTLSAVYIDRINNPKGTGASCNFQPLAIRLATGTGNIAGGLPNEVVYPYRHPVQTTVKEDVLCHTPSAGFAPKMLAAPSGFAHYEWDDGTAAPDRQISAPGDYWVRYYNHTCQYYVDTFRIGSVSLNLSLGPDRSTVFCDHPQSYVELRANVPGATYRWQDSSTAGRFRAHAPGVYWVEATLDGCTAADTVRILADSIPDLGADLLFCEGDTIDHILSLPPLPVGALAQWSNGSRAPFIHITDTGVYRLEMLIPPCIFSDSIRVSVRSCDTLPRDTLLPACTVYLPNAFSPNGDGVNDRFQPLLEAGCPVQSYQLNIYNRYGVRVFAGNDPARGWDGIFRGEPAPVGTYFYEMRWTGRDGRSFFRKGDVTLVR